MKNTSTVTSKGQVTIPAKFRKLTKIGPSDKVYFRMEENNLVVEKVPSIDELAGSLANPNVEPLTDRQLDRLTKNMLLQA